MTIKKLNCVIIEANTKDAHFLENQLNNNPDIDKVLVFFNAYDGILYVKKHQVDLIFFNLETPYAMSSGLIDKNSSFLPLTIVTSQFEKNRPQGTKTKRILGYIIKPLEEITVKAYVLEASKILFPRSQRYHIS